MQHVKNHCKIHADSYGRGASKSLLFRLTAKSQAREDNEREREEKIKEKSLSVSVK